MKPEEEVASIIQERLQSDVIASGTPKPRRAYITVKSGFHRNAISALLEAFPDTTISTITGLDLGDAIELDYHLWCGKAEATIRTKVAKSEPEIETITDIMSGASLYEREFQTFLA